MNTLESIYANVEVSINQTAVTDLGDSIDGCIRHFPCLIILELKLRAAHV